MDVFDLQEKVTGEYLDRVENFRNIADRRISDTDAIKIKSECCPDGTCMHLNPGFESIGRIETRAGGKFSHNECDRDNQVGDNGALTLSSLSLNPKQGTGRRYHIWSGVGVWFTESFRDIFRSPQFGLFAGYISDSLLFWASLMPHTRRVSLQDSFDDRKC